MNKGICVAGNLIVDILYPIERYPQPGQLTTIGDGIHRSSGGLVCNVIMDLAALDPQLPLKAAGLIGDDSEGEFILNCLHRFPNINTSHVIRQGRTSFTAVMAEEKVRTFFQYRGANALFDKKHLNFDRISCDMLHIGYLLLLDALDAPDAHHNTRMAALLREAREQGIKTSIDMVSESGDRYSQIVPPALRYTDYCIINEIEAGMTTGINLRDADGTLLVDCIPEALQRLMDMGISTWAVIHAPEGGWGMDSYGRIEWMKGASLPQGFIKGTVGAGDAYCAGVLLAAYKGRTLREALELGTAAAVCSLSEDDATSGMRSEAEAHQLLNAINMFHPTFAMAK